MNVWVPRSATGSLLPRAFTDRETGEEWLALYRILDADRPGYDPTYELCEMDVPPQALSELDEGDVR